MSSRRSFLSYLAGSMSVFYDELHSKPQLKLSDISKLPDEKMRNVIPIVNDLNVYSIDKGFLLETNKETKVKQAVYELTATEAAIFPLFSEKKNLGELSSKAAEIHNFSEEEAFMVMRDLFLNLLKRKVCFPANVVEHETD